MEQDALDNSHFLCLLGHLNDTSVGVAAIVVLGQRHPPLTRVILHFLLIFVLIEHLDRAATHSHGNDAHTDVLRKTLDHSASEVIAGTQSAVRTYQWRSSLVPLSLCA